MTKFRYCCARSLRGGLLDTVVSGRSPKGFAPRELQKMMPTDLLCQKTAHAAFGPLCKEHLKTAQDRLKANVSSAPLRQVRGLSFTMIIFCGCVLREIFISSMRIMLADKGGRQE